MGPPFAPSPVPPSGPLQGEGSRLRPPRSSQESSRNKPQSERDLTSIATGFQACVRISTSTFPCQQTRFAGHGGTGQALTAQHSPAPASTAALGELEGPGSVAQPLVGLEEALALYRGVIRGVLARSRAMVPCLVPPGTKSPWRLLTRAWCHRHGVFWGF